ncbi:MAG: ankyrin repeat domain-containing protein [Acidobacteriota bacterium]
MTRSHRCLTAVVATLSVVAMAAPLHAGRGAQRASAAPTPAPAPGALADAAMRGDAAAVRDLLAHGASVNGAQGDGMTALHWAAERGHRDLAIALLAAGANVSAVTRLGGFMPLHLAARAGHADVVSVLVAAKAPVGVATTTGAAPLHFAAAAGNAAAITALLDAGAGVNVREPQWGQTPLMFAASAGRTDAVKVLGARGADLSIAAAVVDLTARNRQDSAESRVRNQRVAALQRERAAQMAKIANSAAVPVAPRAARPAVDDGGEPEPLGYAELVGSHGGLTALLLAVRDGRRETAMALLDLGADINQVGAGDRTSPLLMATINGQYDLAAALLERGADARLASDAGATPLYGVLNMQWAPKARHPQPAHYMQQATDYLDLAERFLKAGADVNARLTKSLWYTTYNRDLLGVDRTGATAFWLAAYTLDIPAMKLMLKYGADPNIRTAKVPERYEEGGPDPSLPDKSGLAPIPWSGPAVAAIHAASGVGYGLGFAGNTHRHVPDGWVPAVTFLVEELGADVNARDHNGYTPLHHAASRGDVPLIKYLVSKGADVKAVARTGQTTVDMANGPVQRVQPYPEAIELLESLGALNNHKCGSC